VLLCALTFLLAAMITWFYGSSSSTIAGAVLAKFLLLLFSMLFVMTLGSHLTRSSS
jgi:uncharacterized membrane protein YtjA (UPF0391 family)